MSLLELTALCREETGNQVPIGARSETAAVDVPVYVSDNRRVEAAFGWRPTRGVRDVVAEIVGWIRENETALRPILA